MLTAITRAVSPRINECELTFIDRQAIDFDRAVQQHRNYQQLLRSLGLDVIEIPADERCPDSCFIEDTALVLDEIAVITRPGSEPRRAEVEKVEPSLANYRQPVRIESPGTLEGGDVLQIGRDLFIGVTSRTNRDGIAQLEKYVEPHGYTVHAVEVSGALHLKSVCTAVSKRTILADPTRVDLEPFAGYELIEVPSEEWMAANILLANGAVCMHSGFPKALAILRMAEINVRVLDISEFLKAEAGLTCLSLIFNSART